MDRDKFGIGKIIGLIISFPVFIFLIISFLYIPINLYNTSNTLTGDINPIDKIQGDIWNPLPNENSTERASYGINKLIMSGIRVSAETTLLVILPALIFSIIILYLSPLWIRTILETLRDFLYFIPVILLAYMGYFYISPLITGETGNLSALLSSRVLILFAFPYAVWSFMHGLEKIWPADNTANPTFAGRVLHKDFKIKKLIAFVVILILVALSVFAKVFGETIIFSLLAGSGLPENFMDLSLPASNTSSAVMDFMTSVNLDTITKSGNIAIGIVLFVTMLIYIFTFIVSAISNVGMAVVGTIFRHEHREAKLNYSKAPVIKGFFKIIFSIIGLLALAGLVYYIVINLPEYTNKISLIDKFPEYTEFIDKIDIALESVTYFAINFIWYAFLLGIPSGLFLGLIVKDSMLEHYMLAILRTFDNIPIICVGIFGYVFFILGNITETFTVLAAGFTTALFLSPKIAMLTYEAISHGKLNYKLVKRDKPYISIAKDSFIGLLRIVGAGFMAYGLMFGILVTIIFTGNELIMTGFIPHNDAPFMSLSAHLYSLMNSNTDLTNIKPVLDNYYVIILTRFSLYFLIGTGIKLLSSIIDSIKLIDFQRNS